ncbi:MAG: MazG nucleotide pyrophosphohydrolase domain-containing protein [Bacilli bacterium]
MMISFLRKKVMRVLKQTTIKNDRNKLIAKLNEETLELSLSIREGNNKNAREEIADCLIVLAQIMEIVEFGESDLDKKLEDVKRRYGG